jgi:hypothetical protein
MDEKIEGLYLFCEKWEDCLMSGDADGVEVYWEHVKRWFESINRELAASEELATRYGPDVAAVIARFPVLEG